MLVERFDRRFKHNHTQVQRRHTIDGCQLLNRDAMQPATHTLQLLDWTIFNLLTGNADCHAKNLSFFVDAQGIELSPFYDLVNVMLFDFAHDWAMGLGDEFLDNGALPSTYDLACFAHACGLQGSMVSKRFEKQIEALHTQAEGLLLNLPCHNQQEEQHLQQYLQVLRTRLTHFEKHSRAIQPAIKKLVVQ